MCILTNLLSVVSREGGATEGRVRLRGPLPHTHNLCTCKRSVKRGNDLIRIKS